MLEGNLNDTIYLRTKDEGDSLAALINSFNSQLSKKIMDIDKHSQSIVEQIELIDQTDGLSVDKDSLLESYNSIRNHNNAIRKVTTSFTLVDE